MDNEDFLKPLSELTAQERQVLRERLSQLSNREREVLPAFCDVLSSPTIQNTLYDAIGKRLFIAEKTVGVHLSNIRGKLGITHLHPFQQAIILSRTCGPLLREEELPPAPTVDTIEPEPIPEPEMKEAEEFERIILAWKQTPPTTKEVVHEQHPRPRRLRWLFVGVVLGGLLALAIGYAVREYLPTVASRLVGAATQPVQDTQTPVVQVVTHEGEIVREVTATPAPPQPTPTPVVQTREVVIVVTATPEPILPTDTPPAAITPTQDPRLFSDDFETGISPEWNIEGDNFTMVEGSLSSLGRYCQMLWIEV